MSTAGASEIPEYLVVGAHSAGHIKSVIGTQVQRPAVLQLWSIPQRKSAANSSDACLPKLEMCICHEGGLTWDCKWCPSDASMPVQASQDAHSGSLPRHVRPALPFAMLAYPSLHANHSAFHAYMVKGRLPLH